MGQSETICNLTKLVQIDARTRNERMSKKTILAKNYKRQDIVENHDCPCTEGTWHKKEVVVLENLV